MQTSRKIFEYCVVLLARELVEDSGKTYLKLSEILLRVYT